MSAGNTATWHGSVADSYRTRRTLTARVGHRTRGVYAHAVSTSEHTDTCTGTFTAAVRLAPKLGSNQDAPRRVNRYMNVAHPHHGMSLSPKATRCRSMKRRGGALNACA